MPSIKKAESGTYRLRFRVIANGKSTEISKQGFKTKKAASTWMTKYLSENVDNEGNLKKIDYTFAEYFEKWYMTYKMDKAPATIHQYHQTLVTIQKYFKRTLLKDITRTMLQEFLNKYGAKNAIETVSKKRGHMKQCLRAAYADGLIDRDPTYSLEATGLPGKKEEEKFLEENDYLKIIDYVSQRVDDYPMLLIYITAKTGMRTGEARALTYRDFDFKNKTVRINKTVDEKKNVKEPKTKSSIRTITVDDSLLEAVKDMKKNFRFITTNGLNKRFKEVLKAVGCEEGVTFYSLRHTHGSYLLKNGVDVSYVSKRLGHKDISITMRKYLHLLDSQKTFEENKTSKILNKL